MGNWRVVAAHTDPLGRSYTLVRIDAVMTFDDEGRSIYEEQDIEVGASGFVLQRIRIAGDAPLTRDGETVPPCPVPLHYRILARKVPGPTLSGLSVRERSRRTSAPDFALALTSHNAESGITITPRAQHLPLPEPVAVEAPVLLLDPEQEEDELPLARDVQRIARETNRRSRRSGRRSVPELGHPEEECACQCHLVTKETDADARCDCDTPGAPCTPGRRG